MVAAGPDGDPPQPRRRWDRVRDVEVFSIVSPPTTASTAPGEPEAPDVVLVHGLAMSNRYLVPLVRELATHGRVFAPDLPGVGRSSRPSHQPTVAELADGLRDWMDAVGVDRAVVIGHSFGCHVVAQLAARHPARVEAVVLVSPAGDPSQRSVWEQAGRLLLDGFREHPTLLPIALRDYARVGVVRMLRTLRSARRGDAVVRVDRIRQTALVVRGDRDPLISAEWAQRLARALPAGSLVTVPGAPHAVHYSSLPSFLAAVGPFLRSVTPSSPRA